MKKEVVSEYIIKQTNEKTGAITYQVEIRKRIDGEQFYYFESFPVKKWKTEKNALQQAKKRRNQKLEEFEFGMYLTTDRSVQNYTTDELFECLPELMGWTVETISCKKRLYAGRIQPQFGKKKFKSIRAEDIQRNLNNLIDTSSDNVISTVLTLWRQLYKAALMMRITSYDLTAVIKKPVSNKASLTMEKEYNDEDFYKLLNILSNPSPNLMEEEIYEHRVYHTVLITMYYLGCRPGEALSLHKNKIDFKKHKLLIDTSIGSSTTERTVVKRTKRKKSVRWLPIHPYLEEILIDWISSNNITDFLFLDYHGNLISTKRFSSLISGIAKYHDIDFTPYRLRHRFSTDLLQANVDPRTIIELMGHASFRTSVDYARSNDNLKMQVIESRATITSEKVAEKVAEKRNSQKTEY